MTVNIERDKMDLFVRASHACPTVLMALILLWFIRDFKTNILTIERVMQQLLINNYSLSSNGLLTQKP